MSARNTLLLSTSLVALLATAGPGSAQVTILQPVTLPAGVTLPPGRVVVKPTSRGPLIVAPKSDVAAPGHAHTNALRLIPRSGFPQAKRLSGPPVAGDLFETPASLACIYELGVGGKSVMSYTPKFRCPGWRSRPSRGRRGNRLRRRPPLSMR
jgi:hypothetical protein